ncbi:hypothetical protein C8T65DRAFT_267385 [Cerioporus squamosus]|nr:hypothetical protein C8T65DRAFT_267385 [Cerioporus squamosus]
MPQASIMLCPFPSAQRRPRPEPSARPPLPLLLHRRHAASILHKQPPRPGRRKEEKAQGKRVGRAGKQRLGMTQHRPRNGMRKQIQQSCEAPSLRPSISPLRFSDLIGYRYLSRTKTHAGVAPTRPSRASNSISQPMRRRRRWQYQWHAAGPAGLPSTPRCRPRRAASSSHASLARWRAASMRCRARRHAMLLSLTKSEGGKEARVTGQPPWLTVSLPKCARCAFLVPHMHPAGVRRGIANVRAPPLDQWLLQPARRHQSGQQHGGGTRAHKRRGRAAPTKSGK